MAELDAVVEYLDRELRTAEIADYPGAINGLQLENSGKITRIIAAVDASARVIQAAAEERESLLIVHHGLFWQGVRPITKALYKKLKTAMDADLAIYSSHLPLDVHPLWGNNIGLAKAINLISPEPFFDEKGLKLGLRGAWSGTRAELALVLAQVVGGRVHLCPGGPEIIQSLGLITGGAGSQIEKVADFGLDTFITGEGPHWSYTLAGELGVNLFYAGHYATETFGVKALSAALGRKFGIQVSFFDHPSGM